MSHLFALFLVTSFANIVTPGLGVFLIITLAVAYGWKRTLPGCLGLALGITVLFIAALSGVGVVVAASPTLFALIKAAGGFMLAWMALKSFRRSAPSGIAAIEPAPNQSAAELFSKCFLLSITNPQPIVFGISVLPQFIDPALPYARQAVVMIAVYTLMVFLTMVAYALLASRARTFVLKGRGPVLMYRASGTVFLFLALYVWWSAVSGFMAAA